MHAPTAMPVLRVTGRLRKARLHGAGYAQTLGQPVVRRRPRTNHPPPPRPTPPAQHQPSTNPEHGSQYATAHGWRTARPYVSGKP